MIKLQINKKVSDAKTAMFAVADSLNFYVQPESLKDINVSKLSDQIVTETRRQYGDTFTKTNLELILNQIVKHMTTTAKPVKIPKAPMSEKKEVQLTESDLEIVNSSDSFNKKIANLQHLWTHPSVLSKAFSKSRQRVINAINIAKEKQK